MKALVYGGAFNPPTRAHIELAEFALKETASDKVIFVPSKMRYIQEDQKKDFAFSDEERMKMLKDIASKREWMEVSDYELVSEEQPRIYVTMCYLRSLGYECRLLFGSDKLHELENGWRYVDELCREFGICCMERNEDSCSEMIDNNPYLRTLKPYITVIHTPADYRHISSTQVRRLYQNVKENLSEISELIPGELNGLREFLLKEENK